MESPRPSFPDPRFERPWRLARRRGLVVFAVLVVLLHAALIGGVDWPSLAREPGAPEAGSMVVRSIEANPVAVAPEAALPVVVPPPPPRAATARPPARPRRSTAPSLAGKVSTRTAANPTDKGPEPVALEPAVDPLAAAPSAPPGAEASAASAPGPALAAAPAPAPEAAPEAAPEPAIAVTPPASAASSTFLATGEAPPPTYRTLLPPSTNLYYEVRRGFLRGTGAIRWQRVDNEYGIHLDARIAALTLLAQTSQGVVDATGLAPTRFLDQRIRRAAQAANFNRDAGTITYSGPGAVWPLLPGTQDRLSWMIQLAGIVAAEPERASEGGRIAMVIVGARGEASVRTLRFAGSEAASTTSGSVPALKFVVDARSAYDSSYEIWLDPAHDYLPVHATQRNSAGEADFELFLDRVEPGP